MKSLLTTPSRNRVVKLTNHRAQLTRIAVASLAFVSSMSVFADTQDYDFAQLNLVAANYTDLSPFDLIGLEARASKGIGRFFGEIRYRDLTDDQQGIDFDEDRLNLSLGYVVAQWDKTRIDVRGNYGDIGIKLSNSQRADKTDIEYFGISSYVFHKLNPKVELYGGLEFQDWDFGATQKAYHLGGSYKVNQFSFGAEYTKYSDSEAASLFARYHF